MHVIACEKATSLEVHVYIFSVLEGLVFMVNRYDFFLTLKKEI